MVALGYGGSRVDAGKSIGQSGDEGIDPKVILIDGRTLCELMIDYGLGTATTAKYEIKRIDSDYFAEE